jgi:hypothetical protein
MLLIGRGAMFDAVHGRSINPQRPSRSVPIAKFKSLILTFL